jgi:hypothetical protein
MSDSVNIEKLKKLREPFPPEAISQLPKGGTTLSFVGHANITDRLLNIDPLWTWEPVAFDERGLPAMDYDAQGKAVGLWIRLTICGVSRLGYGTCLASKTENVKELIGDALRNAAMRFGVALELWSKAELESQHDDSAPRESTPQRAPQAPPQRGPESNGKVPINGNGRPPQAAIAPQKSGPKLSPMQELMKLCEGAGLCCDESGAAIVPQIVNVLKKENFSVNITAENYPAAFAAIERHYADTVPAREALELQRGKPMPVGALANEYDNDDSDPFGDLE